MKALLEFPSGLHADTSDLVIRFAEALAAKLLESQEKYGFSNHWMSEGWREGLVIELVKHVEKGDPRDVSAYCAFAWHHGWSTRPTVTVGMLQWLSRLVADFPWAEQSVETRAEAIKLSLQLKAVVVRAALEGGAK